MFPNLIMMCPDFGTPLGFSEQHLQPKRHLHDLVAGNAPKNAEVIGELQLHTPFNRGAYSFVKREDEAENFNLFKLEDVEEILRQKNHNRCRWSHVFPQGECVVCSHRNKNTFTVNVGAGKSSVPRTGQPDRIGSLSQHQQFCL